MTAVLLALGAFGASTALTWALRGWAVRRQLLDIPNERSSHQQPVPRVGGLAIVIVVCLGTVAGWLLGDVPPRTLMAILPAGLLLAVVGYVDDRRGFSALMRFLAHAAAVGWLLWCYGGVPEVGISSVDSAPMVRDSIGALALIWFINLFNFMDGIDGIAASEALFIGALVMLLTTLAGGDPDGVVPVLLGATAGFLVWNWPRASIFMGDVGSGFLGFLLGAVVVDACVHHGLSPLLFLIGAGFFIVDATTTLVRRVARRERAFQAHRSHAYQHLAIRWGSHRRVVLTVVGINLLWLLPWALVASRFPHLTVWSLGASLIPLAGFVLWAGANSCKEGTK